jgi:hypothetical protein
MWVCGCRTVDAPRFSLQAGKRVHHAVDAWMTAQQWTKEHFRGPLEAAVADLEALDPPAGGYAAEELARALFWMEPCDDML